MGARSRRVALAAGLGALGLSGCGSKGKLSSFPTSLDWGILDFQVDVPDEGLAVKELAIQNVGEEELNVQVTGFDFEHLCAEGFTAAPLDLGVLGPGSVYQLFVGVCDYDREGGERDTLVRGDIVIEADELKEPLTVGWSFTPTIDLGGEDSG